MKFASQCGALKARGAIGQEVEVVIGWLASSTTAGSAAPAQSQSPDGTVQTNRRIRVIRQVWNQVPNASVDAVAHQLALNVLLNAPANVFTVKFASSLPNTAIMRSVASCTWT